MNQMFLLLYKLQAIVSSICITLGLKKGKEKGKKDTKGKETQICFYLWIKIDMHALLPG